MIEEVFYGTSRPATFFIIAGRPVRLERIGMMEFGFPRRQRRAHRAALEREQNAPDEQSRGRDRHVQE